MGERGFAVVNACCMYVCVSCILLCQRARAYVRVCCAGLAAGELVGCRSEWRVAHTMYPLMPRGVCWLKLQSKANTYVELVLTHAQQLRVVRFEFACE